jgi:hypothetical protein
LGFFVCFKGAMKSVRQCLAAPCVALITAFGFLGLVSARTVVTFNANAAYPLRELIRRFAAADIESATAIGKSFARADIV